jgi:cytidylate kinase
VVFPDAPLKVYLDATPEVRAGRRFRQGISDMTLDELADNIRMRDQIDRNKEEGSLKIAEGAFYLDTSYLTIEEVCEKVVRKFHDIRSQ